MPFNPADYRGSERPMQIELIRSMARGIITEQQADKLQKHLDDHGPEPNTRDAFIRKPASEWLSMPAEQRTDDMLFGEFWYKGELCILFADTNVGKSILAVQIGDSVSRGHPISGMATIHQPEPVLYFDFELSANQFAKRYSSHLHGNYSFAGNFNRLVLNPDANKEQKFSSYHDYIINAFENVLVETKARTVIIDNITCLRTSTDSAAGAFKLMHSLHQVKNRYGLSMLVLAHTPKRNPARPITRNDLQGSKMLLNFADSAFSIGESHTAGGMRYLKQIKQRSGQLAFPASGVLMCRITKPANFVQFELTGSANEAAHLLSHNQLQQKATEDRVLKLHASCHSIRQIAAELNIPGTTVFRILKRIEKNG